MEEEGFEVPLLKVTGPQLRLDGLEVFEVIEVLHPIQILLLQHCYNPGYRWGLFPEPDALLGVQAQVSLEDME